MSSVQSVERAFAVLRCLASGPTGVTDIADRTTLPKSTVSRLLATLQDLGAVEQHDVGGEYRIGNAIVELAAGAGSSVDLVAISRPHLVELAEAVGEATGLSVLDRDQAHYIAQVDATHAVQVRDWTGDSFPLHLVPSGLVLLAAAAPAFRERYLSGGLVATTPRSVTDPAAISARLEQVARVGYAWVYEEFAEGLNSVAALVRGVDGEPVAAIHAHGPSYRFPGDADPARIGEMVRDAAAHVAERLHS
jgi:DNA-binding IclR family transcriptional regulator